MKKKQLLFQASLRYNNKYKGVSMFRSGSEFELSNRVGIHPYRWGITTAFVLLILYLLLLLLGYHGYKVFNISTVISWYPGFSLETKGLLVGALWSVFDGFAVGYVLGFLFSYMIKR